MEELGLLEWANAKKVINFDRLVFKNSKSFGKLKKLSLILYILVFVRASL